MNRLYRLYTISKCDPKRKIGIKFPLHDPIIEDEEDKLSEEVEETQGNKFKCISIKFRGVTGQQLKGIGQEGDFFLLLCNGYLYRFINGRWCLEFLDEGFYFLDILNCFIYSVDIENQKVEKIEDKCNLKKDDKILDDLTGVLYNFDGIQWKPDCNLRGSESTQCYLDFNNGFEENDSIMEINLKTQKFFASPNFYIPGNQDLIIYDSSNQGPLGTPNEDFFGPGIGKGGKKGKTGENNEYLGNLLVLNNSSGGTIIINFDFPILITTLELINIDIIGSKIETYNGNQLINTTFIPILGTNSYQKIRIDDNNVTQLRIITVSLIGIANIGYKLASNVYQIPKSFQAFYKMTDTEDPTIDIDGVFIPWNQQEVVSSSYQHIIPNSDIKILNDGDYEICINVSTEIRIGDSPSSCEVMIYKQTGSLDPYPLEGTSALLFNHDESQGYNTCSIKTRKSLKVNDVIKVFVRKFMANESIIKLYDNGSRIMIKTID